jgi:hypothetical protein
MKLDSKIGRLPPYRFQRRRVRGWRKPPGGIIVDRTTAFGNAHNHEELGRPLASAGSCVTW